MNKKQRDFFNRYLCSDCRAIYDAYACPSPAKVRAYEWCLKRCDEMNGRDPRIIGYNCMQFSFGFVYTKDGKEWFHCETATNTYDFVIE